MRNVLNRILGWDFISMGKGIESRYARCSEFWEPHLRCTRAFIAEHMRPGGRLAILGAGRLLDVDLPALAPYFSEIHLFDADPSVIRAWREASGSLFRTKVVPRILDVTGSLGEWTRGLKKAGRTGALDSYLSSLEPGRAGWEDERFDGVISLNLLGQIPLYWRDRVLDCAGHLSARERGALIDSMERLQRAHLDSVRSGAGSWSIVISDTEYYTYTTDASTWEVESALHGDVYEDFRGLSSPKEAQASSSWLWHLNPQFIEGGTHGAIHRVEARVLYL